MADDDYEVLPHQLLADLKSEVEALKKKLTQPDTKANELILEMESMKDSIHELNTIFQKALEQTKEEDLSKVIKIISQKLETVVTQNETIAKGMIAISDKLEDFMASQTGAVSVRTPSMPSPVQHTMGMPQMRGSRMAPPLQMEPPSFAEPEFPIAMGSDNPPPPPPPGSAGKKKLIGTIFK